MWFFFFKVLKIIIITSDVYPYFADTKSCQFFCACVYVCAHKKWRNRSIWITGLLVNPFDFLFILKYSLWKYRNSWKEIKPSFINQNFFPLRFGYGLMDAFGMVELAKNWTTVPPQRKCEVPSAHIDKWV